MQAPSMSSLSDSGALGDVVEEQNEIQPQTDNEEGTTVVSQQSVVSPTNFTVNLDGMDWLLTTLLVTVDVLLLQIRQTGGSKWATLLTWLGDVSCDSGWECRLAKTMFLLAVAVVNVAVLVPVINVNVRTPNRASWRFWMLSATASLALLNVMMVLQLTDSILKATDPNDDHNNWVSQFALVGMVVLTTLMLDVRFMMLYGLCSCVTCRESKTLEMWNGLRVIAGLPQKRGRVHLRDALNLGRLIDRSMYGSEHPNWTKGGGATFKFVQNVQEGVGRFVRRRRLQNMRHLLSHRMTDQITDMPSEEVGHYLDEIMHNRATFLWSVTRQKFFSWWDEISEEPGFFEYSSWMKAAISITILLLIYNCILGMEVIFRLDSVWDSSHRAVIQLQSGVDSMHRYAFSIEESLDQIASIDPSQAPKAVDDLYRSITKEIDTLDDALQRFSPDGVTDSSSYQHAGALMHMVMIRSSKLIQRGDYSADKVVSAISYADSLIRWLKYACMMGYPIGTMIGFYSLHQVMRQYKEMSMGLAREQHVRSKYVVNRPDIVKPQLREGLMGLEEKYPIGGAVYFIGVLASTAVVQQHVFGMTTTMSIAIFLNGGNFDVLLDFGGYVAIVYLIIIVANYICSHIIGDRLLTQDGFKIRYPLLFFLFLAVFTIVHAVLGFFYALWRGLLLIGTTFMVINRLDISLFHIGKKLDNGHSSFMSMLLLTHIIRLENEARIRAGDPSTPLHHVSQDVASYMSATPTAA